MSWIDKILPSGVRKDGGQKRSNVPEGLWTKCVKCEAVLYRPDVERNGEVCPKCDHHMRIGARRRLDLFLDPEGREELLTEVGPVDRLKFKDKKRYRDRLLTAQKTTGEKDALVAMSGTLYGMPVIALAFEFNFHGGSMGYAVGEKFTRAAQTAIERRVPLVCFAASGGARMQEALISLMQMAKTSAVIELMKRERVPYISVMTDPIYGGVSASLALLGDINVAEPEARAGFAGPNIIEQTIRQKLPKGFQRSEFLLEHGAIDMIVHRQDLRDTITRLLTKLTRQPSIAAASHVDDEGDPEADSTADAAVGAGPGAEAVEVSAAAEAAGDGDERVAASAEPAATGRGAGTADDDASVSRSASAEDAPEGARAAAGDADPEQPGEGEAADPGDEESNKRVDG